MEPQALSDDLVETKFEPRQVCFDERVEFGDRILTKIWRTGDGEALPQAETRNGKIALSQARATFRPA